MRIISGKFKGQLLKMPKGSKIRPSSQRVKAALFNILNSRICGATLLELFAGSGNIGIEALSRGAKKVFFVEKNYSCIRAIETNLKHIGIGYTLRLTRHTKEEVSAVLLPFDVERAIKMLHQKGQRFDLVFLDPPYYQDESKNSLIKICRYDILRPHSYVIVEHNKREVLPHLLEGLRLIFSKSYGDSILSFYKKETKL